MPRASLLCRSICLLAGLVLMPALVANPAAATSGQIHIVKGASANLRAGPSTESKVIGRLRRGDRLMEFGRRGQWIRVQQMGRVAPEGWMHGKLVGPEPRPETAPAPQPVPAPPPAAVPRRPTPSPYDRGYGRRSYLHGGRHHHRFRFADGRKGRLLAGPGVVWVISRPARGPRGGRPGGGQRR